MNFNDVDAGVLGRAIPHLGAITFVTSGGQKRVFRCQADGREWALKLHLVADAPRLPATPPADDDESPLDTVVARARREVQALGRRDMPHLAKLGPGGLQPLQIDNLSMVYYLEEFIEGVDVRTALHRDGPFADGAVARLGIHVARAIDALWSSDPDARLIHRDIKPANIMRRPNGDYVLLDIGLAFDVFDESLTAYGRIPGTAPYLSPDQLDYANKRQMDYRSDFFALGTVMYEVVSGLHPFHRTGMSSSDLYSAIVLVDPKPLAEVKPGINAGLASIIHRLLAKRPHLRYRTCSDLIQALEALNFGNNPL